MRLTYKDYLTKSVFLKVMETILANLFVRILSLNELNFLSVIIYGKINLIRNSSTFKIILISLYSSKLIKNPLDKIEDGLIKHERAEGMKAMAFKEFATTSYVISIAIDIPQPLKVYFTDRGERNLCIFSREAFFISS